MDNHAHIRSNLNGLTKKLNSDRCKIAYMGSSVTVQKEGYRIFLQQFLRDYFHQEHLEILAAIGGVGSITGVFTMDEDVIRYAPDLCVIEYMVSDRIEANTPQAEIGKVIEGIVRKLRQVNCQIIFLYRYLEQNLINERYTDALNEYEKIAQHYNITSINFGTYIQASIDAQKYSHEHLFKDHTHTTKAGSQIIANYIAKILSKIFKSNRTLPESKQNIKPIYLDNYSDTSIVYLDESFLANQRNYSKGLCSDKVKNHQSKNKDYQYFEIDSNNNFQFQIQGELIGLMVIVGRDSGIIEVSANNQSDQVMLWDKWCHYDRFTTVILAKNYSQMTEIKITITDEPIDYSTCRREIINPEQIIKKIKLVGLMTRANTQIISHHNSIQSLTIPELIAAAKICESKQQYDQALGLHLKAIKIAANRRTCMALAQHILKREKMQTVNLNQFLAIHPIPAFLINLAHSFSDLKEFDKSVICFRQAIKINPRLAEDILPIMRAIKLEQNKENEAIELYQEWIERYYIINHQHKIIYCPIPKNACTLFKEIMIEHSEHQTDFQESDLDVHRYIRQNNVQLNDFTYLANPDYLNIAICRNPFDRLVSAYLNKFVRPKKASQIVKNVIKDIYRNRHQKPDYKKSITFSEFINYLVKTEDHNLNEHWRSQYFFLGMGLVEFNLFNSLENVSQIIQQLESRMGINISKQKTKNKTNYSENIISQDWHQIYPQKLRKLKQLPPANSLYTAELIALVKQRYALDIEIYENISKGSLTINDIS